MSQPGEQDACKPREGPRNQCQPIGQPTELFLNRVVGIWAVPHLSRYRSFLEQVGC